MADLENDNLRGLYPVDFILELAILEELEWFRANPNTAPDAVFGQLKPTYLATRGYGDTKIREMRDFINKTNIPVVQHWSLVDAHLPCFSIQLMDGREDETKVGMGDFLEELDTLDVNDVPEKREEILYTAMSDSLQIGIHATGTPDIVKYLYALLVSAFMRRDRLQKRGFNLVTWQATDLSRINEYLPEHIYSRFVNFSVVTFPTFVSEDEMQLIDTIEGVHIEPTDPGGITPDDISQ